MVDELRRLMHWFERPAPVRPAAATAAAATATAPPCDGAWLDRYLFDRDERMASSLRRRDRS